MFWPDGVSNNKLSNTAYFDIVSKGRIGLFGPILLQNSRFNSEQTAIIASYGGGTGHIRTFIGAGLSGNGDIDFDDISTKVENIENGDNDNFQDMLSNGSRLYLVANKIMIDGKAEDPTIYPGIIPVKDVNITLGTAEKRFVQVNTQAIGVNGAANPEVATGLNITSYFISDDKEDSVTIGIIKQGAAGDAVAQIGQQGSPIDYGFFGNLTATNVLATSISATSITATSISATSITATSISATDITATNYAGTSFNDLKWFVTTGTSAYTDTTILNFPSINTSAVRGISLMLNQKNMLGWVPVSIDAQNSNNGIYLNNNNPTVQIGFLGINSTFQQRNNTIEYRLIIYYV